MTKLLFTNRGRIDEKDGESQKFIRGFESKLLRRYETWSIIGHLRYAAGPIYVADTKLASYVYHIRKSSSS